MTALLAAWAAVKNFPAWAWEALGVVALGLLIYHAGYSAAHTDTLKASIQNLHERKAVNEDVHNLDDARLCRALGGLSDECKHL